MGENKTARRTEQQSYPWLLYFNGDNQIFCSISDPTKTYWRSIPELRAGNIRTVQHGWCLMEDCFRQLLLWNPSNFKKISLPPVKHKAIIKDCILSCSPTATDQVCSIFLFPYRSRKPTNPNILFYAQLGDEHWTEVDYSKDLVRASAVEDHKLHQNDIYLDNPVYCNGRLYAQSSFGRLFAKSSFPQRLLLIIEKLEPHGLQINSAHVYLPDSFPHTFDSITRLLESNNELFHIQISIEKDKIFGIAVHRLDFSQMTWERVKNMKDKVIFLSEEDLPFACQAINPEGGLIYFSSRHSKFVHKYNIEDNSLSICQAFSNLPQRSNHSIWFRPDLRMTLAPQERGKTQTRGGKKERGKTQIRGGKSSATIHSNEIGDGATNSCALSFEIIQVLAEYLNALDYLHLRATNRSFREMAPSLQWRSPFSHCTLSSFDDLSLSPLFAFFEKENVLTFVHPKHGKKYKYSMTLPEDIQGGCEICYSKDGWLLLAVNTFSNMFFNPFTKEVKQLAYGPPTPAQVRTTVAQVRNTPSVGFSHPPTSSECAVVEFHDYCEITVHTTSLGKERWKEFNLGESDFCLTNISPCLHNGAFYYLSNEGKLGILKVSGEEDIYWEECEKPDAPCTHYYKCFLVDCNDSLLSVFEGAFGNWVRVFRLDESKREWMRVESLENHMLFVGNQSFSAVANIPGMENKIYFPRFYDKNIVFYSLETNNYHIFESSEVVDFHYLKEQLNGTWIQPRWR